MNKREPFENSGSPREVGVGPRYLCEIGQEDAEEGAKVLGVARGG